MIRKGTKADIPAIQAVARVAWEYTYKDIMRPETRSHFLDQFYSYEALAKALELKPGGLWVATVGLQVVGFVQVVPMIDKSGLEVTRLYVLPECQRQGVGKMLLSTVMVAYPETKWWALVERDDHMAVAFYAKHLFSRRRDLVLNIMGEDLAFVEFFRQG
ncbi:MAG: GNAT family N-acetyltransferase [Firmicutes bacterium]|nr:GNAT family N-acetyltransferase [Dethiobacter sp.]MBS3889103.1 GNAT family N-acetyltransferase [Bacillota bacterium]